MPERPAKRSRLVRGLKHFLFLHLLEVEDGQIDPIASRILTASTSLLGTSATFGAILFLVPRLVTVQEATILGEVAIFGVISSLAFLLSTMGAFLTMVFHHDRRRLLLLWASSVIMFVGCVGMARTVIEIMFSLGRKIS